VRPSYKNAKKNNLHQFIAAVGGVEDADGAVGGGDGELFSVMIVGDAVDGAFVAGVGVEQIKYGHWVYTILYFIYTFFYSPLFASGQKSLFVCASKTRVSHALSAGQTESAMGNGIDGAPLQPTAQGALIRAPTQRSAETGQAAYDLHKGPHLDKRVRSHGTFVRLCLKS
jgi:hypothetical protein